MKNEKKKNSEHATNFSPENIANAAKKRFWRFWTWDFENGAKVTLGTTLDDLYKEDSSNSCFILEDIGNSMTFEISTFQL